MNLSPQEIQPWIDMLSKPTMGVIFVVVVILYREAVIHIIKTVLDVAASWVKRK